MDTSLLHSISKHKTIGLILFGYVCALSFYVFGVSSEVFGPHDGNAYHYQALESIKNGFGACGNYAHSYWTPLWVETIASIYRVLGENPKIIHGFNIVIILLEALLLYSLAFQHWGKKGAIAAPVFYMSSQLVFRHSSYLQYELYLGFILTLIGFVFYQYTRSKKKYYTPLIFLGMLCMGALLLSAKSLFAIVFVSLVLFALLFCRKHKRQFIAFNLSILIFAGLWIARNHKCFDEFIPLTTNGGVVFFIGNNPNTDIKSYNDPYEVYPEITQKTVKTWKHKKWYKLGTDFIKKEPLLFVKRVLTRILLFFNPHYTEQIVVTLLFLVSIFIGLKNKFPPSLFIAYSLVTIFSFLVLHSIYIYSFRYLLAVWPLMAFMAAGVFSRWKMVRGSP